MNEELEQIARDMRKKERELWAGNPPRMGDGAVALMLDGYASRLEVALGLAPRPKCEATHKEEPLAVVKPPCSGNGAAIHTALDSVRIEMLKRLAGIQPQISDMGILELCVDAQHKPVRNCDRFSSGEEAWIAFERERPNWCDEHSSKDPDCTDCEMADCGRCMSEWLFAKAEGGAE